MDSGLDHKGLEPQKRADGLNWGRVAGEDLREEVALMVGLVGELQWTERPVTPGFVCLVILVLVPPGLSSLQL